MDLEILHFHFAYNESSIFTWNEHAKSEKIRQQYKSDPKVLFKILTPKPDFLLLILQLFEFFFYGTYVFLCSYSFSPSGIYHMPEDTSYEGCLAYIRSLPLTQLPEVFGFHDNADISKDNREAMQLLSATLLTQPQISKVGKWMIYIQDVPEFADTECITWLYVRRSNFSFWQNCIWAITF